MRNQDLEGSDSFLASLGEDHIRASRKLHLSAVSMFTKPPF